MSWSVIPSSLCGRPPGCLNQRWQSGWEMGLSIPTAQYIVELSQLFHVSTDYLLGLNNTQAIYIDRLSQEEKQILYSLIHYFQDKQ